jgi:L-malate glycosyltransferase
MDDRIRIAFVIDQIQSPTAGTEKQLCTIISHLDRERFEPCLCVLKETEWSRTAFGGGTHVVGIDSYLSPGAWGRMWGFASFLRRERFRIVHTFIVTARSSAPWPRAWPACRGSSAPAGTRATG